MYIYVYVCIYICMYIYIYIYIHIHHTYMRSEGVVFSLPSVFPLR